MFQSESIGMKTSNNNPWGIYEKWGVHRLQPQKIWKIVLFPNMEDVPNLFSGTVSIISSSQFFDSVQLFGGGRTLPYASCIHFKYIPIMSVSSHDSIVV